MTIRRAMATAALCAAGLAPGAMAQEAQDSFGLGELSCREVMIRTGEPRATAIAFLQGYLAGSAGLSALSPEALAGTAAAFLEGCLDAPDASALDVMEAAAAE